MHTRGTEHAAILFEHVHPSAKARQKFQANCQSLLLVVVESNDIPAGQTTSTQRRSAEKETTVRRHESEKRMVYLARPRQTPRMGLGPGEQGLTVDLLQYLAKTTVSEIEFERVAYWS